MAKYDIFLNDMKLYDDNLKLSLKDLKTELERFKTSYQKYRNNDAQTDHRTLANSLHKIFDCKKNILNYINIININIYEKTVTDGGGFFDRIRTFQESRSTVVNHINQTLKKVNDALNTVKDVQYKYMLTVKEKKELRDYKLEPAVNEALQDIEMSLRDIQITQENSRRLEHDLDVRRAKLKDQPTPVYKNTTSYYPRSKWKNWNVPSSINKNDFQSYIPSGEIHNVIQSRLKLLTELIAMIENLERIFHEKLQKLGDAMSPSLSLSRRQESPDSASRSRSRSRGGFKRTVKKKVDTTKKKVDLRKKKVYIRKKSVVNKSRKAAV